MFHLRRRKEADRDDPVAVRDAVYPEYRDRRVVWSAAHQLDAPRSAPHRFVVEIASTREVIAYAGIWPWDVQTGRYRLDLIVHPRWQRRGVGDLLLTRCPGQLRKVDAPGSGVRGLPRGARLPAEARSRGDAADARSRARRGRRRRQPDPSERPARRRDLLPLYYHWINDFDVTRTYGTRFRARTWEWMEEWYDRGAKDGSDFVYFTIYERATLRPSRRKPAAPDRA